MRRYKRKCHKNRFTILNICGIIFIIFGLILILEVLPLNFWLFLCGIIVLCLGVLLLKL